MKKFLSFVLMIVLVITFSSCKKEETLLVVTTTSLDNSGLLAYILPEFEKECNCKVKVDADRIDDAAAESYVYIPLF